MATLIIFLSVSGLGLLGVIAFFISRRALRKRISESLQMKLLLVRMPLHNKEGKDLQKEISLTEQLVSALTSFGKPFTLEVAVPNVGEEIYFYISAPSSMRDAFARQIQALWSDASVGETNDYTIFNYVGATVGASLRLKEHYALPIRTYKEINSDTFLSVLGGFSRINDVGEGCVIQYIVTPAPQEKSAIKSAIAGLKKGKKAKEVLKGAEFNWDDLEQVIAPTSKKEGEKTIDQDLIKALEMKLSKPLFRLNVRILASAPSKFQADGLLDGIIAGFSQFSAPERNEFKLVKPGDMSEFIRAYTFREYSVSDTLVLNAEEFASIFHFPTPFTDIPKIKFLKSREAPPPANIPKDGILLGESSYRNVELPVRITREDRRRHTYIIGQTGTGKTVMLNNLASQDIVNREGICVIDPNGDLFEDLLSRIPPERLKDVVVFDPSDLTFPLGLNMLEYDPRFPEHKTLLINELLMIFDTLYDMKTAGGPMFEQYARNALLLLMDDPTNGFTILEIPRVLTDSAFRRKLLAKCTNLLTKEFWEKEAEKAGGDAGLANMAPYITSKFNTFIANDFVRPILAQSKNSLDFRKIMDEGKILLVNLSKGRIGEMNASLLGMIIVGKLTIAAFSRADVPVEKRRDFYLYIDEFQNFTTPSISTILSEARKYRLCLTVAHQFIAQLKQPIKDAIFGNVGNIIAFRVGPDDAKYFATQFAPVFNETDIANIDNLRAHVKLLMQGQVSAPFNVVINFPPRGDINVAERARQHSRETYGRSRVDVEAEIYSRIKQLS